MSKLVQVAFSRSGGKSVTYWKVVWVDTSWKLRPGNIVSFKDETERWTVGIVYNTILEAADLNQKWGLDLPKSQRTER